MLYQNKAINNVKEFKYISDLGNFNSIPKPYKEISHSDFWQYYDTWAYSYTEFRQTYDINEGKNGMVPIEIFYYDTCAYARDKNHGVGVGRYWRIGCDHKWVIEAAGECWSRSKCELCGAETESDSSDCHSYS